ncbi:hypothetical protein GGS20DRAFT_587432 [Poronia punctata]|nr:hypothetical protein GGS20DRAFT_587432 [Poronia punctata]
MQFTTFAISFLAATVAAQDSPSNSTSLPDLVSQLPTCAISCFNTGADRAGCSTTDFTCLCGPGKDKLLSSAGPCALGACSSEDLGKLTSLLTDICVAVSEDPTPSEVASASNLVSSAVAEATESGSAGTKTDLGYGIMGVAAVAGMWAF